jgi:Fe2+ transport system protein FeoA
MMTLNQLCIGQLATIQLVDSDSVLLRLCDVLGLTPVTVLRRSRGKGPMQIKSMGTLYAIRSDEAEQIYVIAA